MGVARTSSAEAESIGVLGGPDAVSVGVVPHVAHRKCAGLGLGHPDAPYAFGIV